MQYPADSNRVLESKCPKCGDQDDLTWGSFDFDVGAIWQPVYCETCDVEWYDIYQLVRQEIVEGEERALGV